MSAGFPAASRSGLVRQLPSADVLAEHHPILKRLGERHLEHRFDLLGSGWVKVHHGMEAAGLEAYRYPPGRPFRDDFRLARRANPANRDEVLRPPPFDRPGVCAD